MANREQKNEHFLQQEWICFLSCFILFFLIYTESKIKWNFLIFVSCNFKKKISHRSNNILMSKIYLLAGLLTSLSLLHVFFCVVIFMQYSNEIYFLYFKSFIFQATIVYNIIFIHSNNSKLNLRWNLLDIFQKLITLHLHLFFIYYLDSGI